MDKRKPIQKSQGKRVHFIGICGVAMSAIAIALHKAGWSVTGSDKGFFPPVSDNLKREGVQFYAGFHPEKMTHSTGSGQVAGGVPDMVIVGNASGGDKNPEFQYAKEYGIPFYSYPEFLGKHFVKENSIVTAGTWGKTSTTALLAHILMEAGKDPSYMLGGIPTNIAPAEMTEGSWSVLEGDEYPSSRFDERPKFAHYSPTHLLLTGIAHDHFDKYPTEESYFKLFEDLISDIPETGIIVTNRDNEGVRKLFEQSDVPEHVRLYGKGDFAHYRYGNVLETQSGITFDIEITGGGGGVYQVTSPLLGTFQAENITGCFALGVEIGIDPNAIIDAIASFRGIKRRLEKRLDYPVTVVDDIAHSPDKARSTLRTLKNVYDGKIVVVFEPNIGSRKREAIEKYRDAFISADTVIIPRLSKLKIDPNELEQPMEGAELARVIEESHKNVHYIDNDEELVRHIKENEKEGGVVAFLGSHGFRGMIEAVIEKLSKK